MPPHPCERCKTARAQILRPKNHSRLCAPCFISAFEAEFAETITSTRLFQPNERIAIGASGGKDSTVLAAVLQTLNNRHNWNLRLELLSIDEGIMGYRDHSLEAVKRHAEMFDLPLTIVSYKDLYGWSMDQVVAQVGKKGNCTYCGVFRRQALDRGAAALGVKHVVTGHNADDVAETVLMNLLRGDLPRLSRATSIVTSMPSAVSEGKEGLKGGDGSRTGEVAFTEVKRSKPLMYAYEKEIVLYAHHRKLDYFSTECIYSPEAFRGSARTLIKNLERIRPESILDVVRSGIDMAKLVPGADGDANGSHGQSACRRDEEQQTGGCGSTGAGSNGREMAEMEDKLLKDEQAEAQGLESEVTFRTKAANGQPQDRDHQKLKFAEVNGTTNGSDGRSKGEKGTSSSAVPIRTKQAKQKDNRSGGKEPTAVPKQKLGQCERCGYLSSQAICKACVLLEGLNKARPRTGIEVGSGDG